MIAENSEGLKNTLSEAQVALRDLNGMISENRPGIRAFIDSASYTMSSAQVIEDAWRAVAPKRLVKEYFDRGRTDG